MSLPCIVLALPRAVEGTLAATALQKLLKLLRCQALADGNPEERSWFTGVPGFWWPLVRTLENDRKVCVCACYKYTLIATHPPSIRFAPYFWCSLSHLSHRGSSVAIPRPVKSSVGLCPPWISKYCLLFIPIALRARAKALWDLSDPWSSAFSFGLVWTDALGAIIDKRHTTPAVPTAPKAKPSSRITKHWLDHSTLSPDTLHIASCYIHTSNSSLLQNLQTFGDSSASSASQFFFFCNRSLNTLRAILYTCNSQQLQTKNNLHHLRALQMAGSTSIPLDDQCFQRSLAQVVWLALGIRLRSAWKGFLVNITHGGIMSRNYRYRLQCILYGFHDLSINIHRYP